MLDIRTTLKAWWINERIWRINSHVWRVYIWWIWWHILRVLHFLGKFRLISTSFYKSVSACGTTIGISTLSTESSCFVNSFSDLFDIFLEGLDSFLGKFIGKRVIRSTGDMVNSILLSKMLEVSTGECIALSPIMIWGNPWISKINLSFSIVTADRVEAVI